MKYKNVKNDFISPNLGLVKAGEIVELDKLPAGIEKIYLREFKEEEKKVEDEQL